MPARDLTLVLLGFGLRLRQGRGPGGLLSAFCVTPPCFLQLVLWYLCPEHDAVLLCQGSVDPLTFVSVACSSALPDSLPPGDCVLASVHGGSVRAFAFYNRAAIHFLPVFWSHVQGRLWAAARPKMWPVGSPQGPRSGGGCGGPTPSAVVLRRPELTKGSVLTYFRLQLWRGVLSPPLWLAHLKVKLHLFNLSRP